jgi:DNA (cytosine-5)-methyltransferase 1
MDLTKFSKTELLEKIVELGIKCKCKSKPKGEIIKLIEIHLMSITNTVNTEFNQTQETVLEPHTKETSKTPDIRIKTNPKKMIDQIIEDEQEEIKDEEIKEEEIKEEEIKGEEIKDEEIKVVCHPTNSLKFIDLFCGIGGFHQALSTLGFECVFASDIDENCRKTYENNYSIKPEGDITKVKIDKIPKFDILCGGFPCQPFSKAGFQQGFNDIRGNLFFNICKIVEKHRPMYLILENVRNLASHDNGKTWNVIRTSIQNLGYYTYDEPVLLNVLHFNIPQNRDRVVIMCKRMDLGNLPLLPKIDKNPKKNLTMFIKDIIDTNINDVKLTGKMKDVYLIWNNFIELFNKNNIDIPKFPIWTDWWDNKFEENDEFYIKYKSWIDKNRNFYADNFDMLNDWLTESRKNVNWVGAVRKFEWQAGNLCDENNSLNKCLWTARGSGIRVKKCDYIPTLVAMSMIPIYGPKNRKLTPIELLRLQSFNDTFKYDKKHIYKQLGNAVNVKMIEKCARYLIYGENLF